MSKNKNLFTRVQMTKPQYNKFDLTHDVKMSGKMGDLMPMLALECIPGDKFDLSVDNLVRFQPLIAPVMHRVDVSMHYFFVPNRILWDGWEDFITNDPNAEAHPYINVDHNFSPEQQKFMDYMGVPPAPNPTLTPVPVNALPFAAYQCIYNEYYRDENLVPEVNYALASGNNTGASGTLCLMRQRAWEHDYFTSALPFAQKGNAVDIPLGNVVLKDTWAADGNSPFFENPIGVVDAGALSNNNAPNQIDTPIGGPNAYDPDGSLITEATTINDLRRAFQLQKFLEINARGGTRYIENILAHFGVHSSDKRLQRPEYITGTKAPVLISEVLNTSNVTADPDGNNPIGTMAGHGVSVNEGRKGSYYCEEHGFIIGIVSIMPKTAYQQGIPKSYLKSDYLDYYWPSFAHIGEQEVQFNELYAYEANGTDTFGYVPRYAEYKYMPSRVAGDFRTTLSHWTLARIFATQPTLNSSFIELLPTDVERIFAVQEGEDNILMHILHKITARRPMPYFGNPTI